MPRIGFRARIPKSTSKSLVILCSHHQISTVRTKNKPLPNSPKPKNKTKQNKTKNETLSVIDIQLAQPLLEPPAFFHVQIPDILHSSSSAEPLNFEPQRLIHIICLLSPRLKSDVVQTWDSTGNCGRKRRKRRRCTANWEDEGKIVCRWDVPCAAE